jgi:hypothetical protein
MPRHHFQLLIVSLYCSDNYEFIYNCRSAASNGFAHKLDGMCFRISIGISESEETKGNGTVLNIWDMCTTQPEKVVGIAVHRPYTYLLSYYVLSKI